MSSSRRAAMGMPKHIHVWTAFMVWSKRCLISDYYCNRP